MKKSVLLIASTLVAGTVALPAMAQQPAKVGTLTCDVSGGIGMIVTSQKTMACTFAPTYGQAGGLYGHHRQIRLGCWRDKPGPHGLGSFRSH